MLLSDEYFAGGVTLGKEAAAYSFILHEHDKYNPSLRARKSWFAFGNRIVCVGSGICNSKGPAHTTLFQNSLESAEGTCSSFSGECELTDRLGNFYYIPDAEVKFEKALQHSFHEETCAPTSGCFEKAYIDHGENCNDGEYVYMVVPGPSSDADKELLKSSCEVLRKDNSVHLVKDSQSGLVGASVFEAGTVDNVILQASQSVMIYALEGDRLSIAGANPDLALYAGASDEVFDEKGKTVKEWKAGGVAVVDGTPVSTTNPTDGLDVLHMSKFVSCIRAKDPVTNVDAEQGVKSSVLPLLANIALDEGETIHLDPKTGKLKSKAGLKGWAREYAKGWELV